MSLEDSPTALRRIGLTLPSCGSAASRFLAEGRAPCYEDRETFLRLRSASEFCLEYPHRKRDARSHEVFRPFDATRTYRATAPGSSRSGSCYVLPLTMRFDVLLPTRPPWCLSTRRVHGVRFPSELSQSEIISTSRCRYPLVRLAIGSTQALSDPKVLKATCLPGPQLIRAACAAGLGRCAAEPAFFQKTCSPVPVHRQGICDSRVTSSEDA